MIPDSPSATLAASCGLAALVYRESVSSTMDMAHELAQQGAVAGTAVLASRQDQGRGRSGRAWQSEADAGLWLTLIERPDDQRALEVLSLRVGLALAEALSLLVDGEIQVKWPNDLYVGNGKLSGILIEVRWRDGRPEWVAIGVGINRRVPPEYRQAAHVRTDVSRDALLRAVVPAIRRAAAGRGPLSEEECEAWAARDLARGRAVSAPIEGHVEGISPTGAVLIRDENGTLHAQHSGSLVFR